MSALLPAYENRSVSIVDEAYLSDRNGRDIERIHADMIEPIQPDWDIDRAGSKGRVELLAHRGILQPNMWIKAYRTVIPEVGEIVRYPLGHWRLGRPGEVYSGFRELDTGAQQNMQNATGSDIVDSIAAVRLNETFVTPAGTIVIEDVRALIKLATAGVVGRNLVTNPGFDTSLSGWTPRVTGGQGDARWSASYGGSAELYFNSGTPVGTTIAVDQDFDIPVGTQFVAVSGLSRTAFTAQLRPRIYIDFRRSGGIISATTVAPRTRANSWVRTFEVIPVPEGTNNVRIYAQAICHSAASFSTSLYWDDIRVSTATRDPLDDSRISLPPSRATASTRIQTMVGNNSSIGYHAINADRLAAIGHQALYTTLSGKVTTTPMRTLATATPKRTYGPGDIRFIGDIEIPDMPTNIPNHFIAIKESFDEGVEAMYAESWNDNPNDAFSTVNSDVVSDEPIYVQDAVDQAALQAVADNARDRHSTQEELHFSIYPDLDLTVYDVIEIADPAMPGAMGKWAIQYIGHEGARMNVSARRAIGGG